MYSVKAYRNVTVLNANGDDFAEEEREVLNVSGVQGHAFGTFTFTLLKEGGACSVYRYDNYDRIEVEPLKEPASAEWEEVDEAGADAANRAAEKKLH